MSQNTENTTQDEQPQKRITNWNNGNAGRAAFIVGALVLEGHIPMDMHDRESLDNIGLSIRVVFDALEAFGLDGTIEMSILPVMQPRENYDDWFPAETCR